jgi:glycosyltransferase involved in cell wall biosynthesis
VSERPLTVLHLVANRWWTGSADPALRLIQGLRARGHRALLGLIPGDRFEAKAREAGIEPIAGLSLEVRFRPWALARDLRALRALVRREGVDVVHTHHSHDHWLGALVRGPAALVRTFHQRRAVRTGGLSSALYRRTDAAIAVSGQIEERARRAGIERVHRVDGVIDVERFAGGDGAAVRAELGITGGPVLGMVSRLAPRRGHELLIRGFQRLLPSLPSARLVLVGKGEAREALEGLVRSLGLGEQVLFAGYRDGDLPAVLAALDVFVLMAAGSDESCRAALEAMAAGRPVLARRVGALPDAIEHRQTGWLIDAEEPAAVEAALRAVLRDPAALAAMGEAAQRQARARFAPARHAGRVEEIYRGALIARARAREREGAAAR